MQFNLHETVLRYDAQSHTASIEFNPGISRVNKDDFVVFNAFAWAGITPRLSYQPDTHGKDHLVSLAIGQGEFAKFLAKGGTIEGWTPEPQQAPAAAHRVRG